ncbi:hemerythrin-like metal-binding domain-containing protein [Thioflavicoccus mobilis 8321]|uniref:Hemerythrin-like metal-binding domain-containing protein n=1 Tax=Thioflavicoccus mobilis 8321 TaxID=765912 RepID=L0GUF4_9GAMM|nr:hemerythrin family protein [Thioflavicoccus mobilis]AGA90408.1 hemerythrin-like metal-binding domain-containing protein [Thioflavicoccus mobilis 8321]
MASSVAWRNRWLLGIDRLDLEHCELIELFNRVVEADPDPGRTAGTTTPTPINHRVETEQLARLEVLIEALRRHFRAEEEFLSSIGYPNYPEHMSEHALHLAELVDLLRRLKIGQEKDQLQRIDDEDLMFMRNWLVNHIAEEQRVARYYFEQLGVGATGDDRGVRYSALPRSGASAAEPPSDLP